MSALGIDSGACHYHVTGVISHLGTTRQQKARSKDTYHLIVCKQTNIAESVFQCEDIWSVVELSVLTEEDLPPCANRVVYIASRRNAISTLKCVYTSHL